MLIVVVLTEELLLAVVVKAEAASSVAGDRTLVFAEGIGLDLLAEKRWVETSFFEEVLLSSEVVLEEAFEIPEMEPDLALGMERAV